MTVSGLNTGIESVRLNGFLLSASVAGAIIGDPSIRRTIEGASEVSFTVTDPEGKLRREPFLDEATRVIVDDLRFALVKVSKSGDDLSLTAEDELIYLLRQAKGPKKAYRDEITRAQFIRSLVKDALGKRVRFFSPELTIEQPVAKGGRPTKTDDPAPGISPDARGLTIKDVPATMAQKRNADRVIRLAMEYKPPRRAVVALLSACIVESLMGTYGMTYSTDGDSIGLLQARTTYVSRENALSYSYNVRRFMLEPWTGTPDGGAIEQAKKGIAPGVIAQSIQGSAFPERYALYTDEAQKLIDAYFGGEAGGFGGGGTTTRTKRYAFEVKKGEDYWTAIKRLADEVGWRAFVVGKTFYFVAEPTLLSSKRKMFVGEQTRGIDAVDWEIDAGKKANTATVKGRIEEWGAPPGTVAELDDSHGPARGKWIVSEIEGSLANEDVTISLKRPSKPKPEPAPETETVQNDSGATAGAASGGAGALADIKFVSFEAGPPYWGGSRAFFNQLLKPFVEENYGFGISSEKRSYNTGSGFSDHYVGSTLAYAVDWGTGSGEACARRIAKLLGASYSPGSWNSSTISAGGRNWTVQILWAAPDGTHYDHVHVGISRQ